MAAACRAIRLAHLARLSRGGVPEKDGVARPTLALVSPTICLAARALREVRRRVGGGWRGAQV